MLKQTEFLDYLTQKEQHFIQDTLWLEQCSSTNTLLLELPPPRKGMFNICYAETQKDGRGQQKRTWISPPDSGIWISFGYSPTTITKQHGLVSIMVGMAIIDALLELGCPQPIQLKWPNDLIINHKKIAGILVEGHTIGKHLSWVIGMGLTIEQHPDFKSLPHLLPLRSLWNNCPSRGQMAAMIFRKLICCIQSIENNRINMRKSFPLYDYLAGKYIAVTQPNTVTLRGQAQGVDPLGQLILATQQGLVTVSHGHISKIEDH